MITLTKATPKAVKYACTHFHYAKSVPATKYAYNVYEDGNWCGCIIYSSGACPNIANSFGLVQGEVLELVRVALNGKQSTTSECVAASMRQLHKDAPQIKIVVSYADYTNQGHMGIIYQATNWLYLGMIKRSDEQYFYNGKWTHYRTIGASKNKEELKQTLPTRKNGNKFKYIYVFNKRLRKQWQAHAKPYPKKENELNGST